MTDAELLTKVRAVVDALDRRISTMSMDVEMDEYLYGVQDGMRDAVTELEGVLDG